MMRISASRFWSEIYILILVLFPIINNYSFFIPVGDLLAIALAPFLYIKRKGNDKVSTENAKYYKIFLVYNFLSLFINFICTDRIDYSDAFSKNFHIILYALYGLYFAKYYFDKKMFYSKLITITNIVVIIEIIEELVYKSLGKQLYLLVPYLKLNYVENTYADYVRNMTLANLGQGYRPSSLFVEPAQFASIVIIGLVIRISKADKNKTDYFMLLLYVISIVLSRSSGGVVSLGLCVFYYLFFCVTKTKGEQRFKISLVFCVAAACMYIIVGNSEIIHILISRISEIGSMVYDTSGNRRVLRGYLVYGKLPILNRVIGTGIGNLLNTITNNNIKVLTDSAFTEEMAQIPYLLCSTGVIGLILYCYSFIRRFNRQENTKKLMIVVFIVSSLYNNYILQASSMLYLVGIFCKTKEG